MILIVGGAAASAAEVIEPPKQTRPGVTTTVGFALTVEDTVTGETKRLSNPDRSAAVPVADIEAFASCSLWAVDPSRAPSGPSWIGEDVG